MKKFNLAQLKYASEVCFQKDFLELFKKHSEGTDLNELADWMLIDFRSKHDCILLNWIFSYSRADYKRGMGPIIEGILTDLVGDYKG